MRVSKVLSQNVTLVYDGMDLPDIDTRDLRKMLGEKRQPAIMETPDMIVAVFPPEPIVIQLGERRIRITVPESEVQVGEVPLWEFAIECTKLVSGSKHNLVAYGFNYELLILDENADARAVTKQAFLANPDSIETILGGTIESFTPRLTFMKGETRFDVILEPRDEHQLKASMNVHNQYQNIELPGGGKLREEFCAGYNYLESIVPKLLTGDK